jgi:hypothetical protein
MTLRRTFDCGGLQVAAKPTAQAAGSTQTVEPPLHVRRQNASGLARVANHIYEHGSGFGGSAYFACEGDAGAAGAVVGF